MTGSTPDVTHRHGRHVHSHPHDGLHRHVRFLRESRAVSPRQTDAQEHAHGHSHGLVDRSIVRSRAGVRAVAVSLAVLMATAGLQIAIFVVSGSVALLADLVHNVGDALTAVPLAIAFLVRSDKAGRGPGTSSSS